MPRRRFVLRGRGAGSGRFIPLSAARRRRKTAIVQRIRLRRRRKKQ